MKTKMSIQKIVKFSSLFVTLAFSSIAFGQIEQYNYKRDLIGISEEWHTIELPNSIFEKVSKNLSDIRIFGITKSNDTIEAPYILTESADKIGKATIAFNSINNSNNASGYYYTFEISNKHILNQLNLDFDIENFDWKLKLEASQNLKEWFTILDNYRVVSIKNELVNYQFTKLTFENSNYKYYRLLVKSKKNPKLKIAQLNFNTFKKGEFRTYSISNISQRIDKKYKQTIVEIELDSMVPINQLKINIDSNKDYYRPYSLEYLTNKFKTEKGWKESYSSIDNGVLNSIDNNEISFSTVTANKLRLTIDNYDNKPLIISSIDCKGHIFKLKVRFDEKADYFLAYGNSSMYKPNYDLSRFPDKIPENTTKISLGNEISIEKKVLTKTEALFINKAWLWILMLIIMVLLTWFSLKMIRNK